MRTMIFWGLFLLGIYALSAWISGNKFNFDTGMIIFSLGVVNGQITNMRGDRVTERNLKLRGILK